MTVLATNFGIYEIGVRPRAFVDEGDDREMQVRSRRELDIVKLRRYYIPELGDIVELGSGKADYQFRAYCTREQLARGMARFAYDINYEKFKEGAEDRKLYSVLSAIWGAWLDGWPRGSSYNK